MEEVELIKVSIQGTDMFLRLAGTGMKEALKFLKFLLSAGLNAPRWWREGAERKYKMKLSEAEYKIVMARQNIAEGSMEPLEFMKLYGSEERTILSIPDSSAEKFSELSKKHGLTYAILPDLNYNDGMFQVMLPAGQADIYKLVIESMVKEEIERNQSKQEELEKKLTETEREIVKCKTEIEEAGGNESEHERYEELHDRLETLELTKEQINDEIEQLQKQYSQMITYDDYMATNPSAFNHADMFSDMMENSVEPELLSPSEFIKFSINTDKNEISKRIVKSDFMTAIEGVTKKTAGKEKKEVIITDINNTEDYIKGYSYQLETEDGSPFLCTEYEVFRNGEKQECEEFPHGKFTHYSDGNAKNSSQKGDAHWENMKEEMLTKSGLRKEQVIVFESMNAYEKYRDIIQGKDKGDEYLVSFEIPGIAIRKDPLTSEGAHMADRFVLLKDGQQSKLVFQIGPDTSEDMRASYLRAIENEIVKANPDADKNVKWLKLTGEDKLKEYLESTKKNIVTDENELKEDFDKALGNEAQVVKETINSQDRVNETDREQTEIPLPSGHYFVLPKELQSENDYYTLYSEDMKFNAKVPVDKIKINASGNKVIVLGKDEKIDVFTRYDNKNAGEITDEKSMTDFVHNNIEKSELHKNIDIDAKSKDSIKEYGKEKS